MDKQKEVDITEPRKKRVELGSLDITDLEGNLESVIHKLEQFKEEGYENIDVESNTYFDEDDGYANLLFWGYRMETEKEVEDRIDAHNKAELAKYLREQATLEKEKQQYLQLKQKFEPA